MEGGLLGAFMVSACVFGVLYGFPGSPVWQAVSSGFLRSLLGGVSVGLVSTGTVCDGQRSTSRSRRSVLVRDPDGHVMELVGK